MTAPSKKNKINTFFVIFILNFVSFNTFGSETTKGMQKDYDSFKKEMNVKVESIEKQIQQLKEKSKSKGQEIKIEALEDLESSKREIESEIKKLESTSTKKWNALKEKISESADNLNAKIQKTLKE